MKINKNTFQGFLFILISTWIYMISIGFGHFEYLPYQTAATGIYKVGDVDLLEWVALFALTTLTTAIVPKKINHLSELFLLIFYAVIYLPTLVLYAGREGSFIFSEKIILIFSITVGFFLVPIILRLDFSRIAVNKIPTLSYDLINFSIGFSVILMVFIFSQSYSNMRFVGLGDTYTQREVGRFDITTSFGLMLGYSKTYLSHLFAPLIFSHGLRRNNKSHIFFAVFIFIFAYMIAAERSVLAYPLLIFAFYRIVKYGNLMVLASVSRYFIFSSIIIFGVAIFFRDSTFVDLVGFLFFTRVIATPGQFIGDYYDFFSERGYTYFSHLRGFNIFIDTPSYFAGDPLWPFLGWIVGRDYHGINSNLNANFVASDGVASAGALGIIFIFIVFAFYLKILNYYSRKWDKLFLIPAAAPLAFIITNGSLFTTMLSYGGGALVVLLVIFKSNSFNVQQ